jgi:hypothetical protein
MPLPKIEYPVYDLELPVSKKKIQYRPYLVKEQKILLMAVESKDKKEIFRAVKQISNNCIVGGGITVEEMSPIDIEWLFIHIRMKSVGETIKRQIPCPKCNEETAVTIDLSTIHCVTSPDHTNKIQISDSVYLLMRYPSIDEIDETTSSDTDEIYKSIANSIECIYDAQQEYRVSEEPAADVVAFIESLQSHQFEKITQFFETMPQIKQKLDITCPKCKYINNIEIEGIENFFS